MQNNKPLQADIVWLLSATKHWVAKISILQWKNNICRWDK